MPNIGEIKTGKEIGRLGKHRETKHIKYIWTACPDCERVRWVSIQSLKKSSGFCQKCCRKGNKHFAWKGGRWEQGQYIKVRLYPDDFFYPMVDKKGYVFEHRLVMAKHLGRCLHIWEIVHHKNGVPKDDNRIGGLQLVSDDRHKQITILEGKIKRLEIENRQLRENNRA